VQPEFLPAFEELQRAMTAGDDVVARRILRGIQARGPTGAALALAQAFERVLAGREAVAELRIKLVVRTESKESPAPTPAPEKDANPTGAPDAAPAGASAAGSPAASTGASVAAPVAAADDEKGSASASPKRAGAAPSSLEARVFLVVENTALVPIELRPGPASLQVTKTSVGHMQVVRFGEPMVGGEEQSTETHPYPALRNLGLDPGGSIEVGLAAFFIDVPAGDLAVRLTFDLDLRSGSIVRDGRELPAMHVPVEGCEATCWGKLLCAELEPTPESLEQYVLRPTSITAECALELAVRLPPDQRKETLDRLAARENEISEQHLLELGPALRWLTEDPTLGGDSNLWRAYLAARAGKRAKERPKLELPARSE
jgi:hypothetical protein